MNYTKLYAIVFFSQSIVVTSIKPNDIPQDVVNVDRIDEFVDMKDVPKECDQRIATHKALWDQIEKGTYNNGQQVKFRVLSTVAGSYADTRYNDAALAPQYGKYIESLDTSVEKQYSGSKTQPEIDKITDRFLRELAKMFVDDAGRLCNQEVMQHPAGLPFAERLWLNRHGKQLVKEHTKVVVDTEKAIDAYNENILQAIAHADQAPCNVTVNDTFVDDTFWQRPEIANNPVTKLTTLTILYQNNKIPFQSWVNGQLDEKFNQYVKEELARQNPNPYTVEELKNMSPEDLEELFPSPDSINERPVRVFPADSKDFHNPPYFLFPTVSRILQIFLKIKPTFTGNVGFTKTEPLIKNVLRI
ncbi:hypothetical protein IPH25_01930 [bacterium]|nr:MAG: hypothetical protein IPG37_04060 [bacterium]QQR62185.1 MAG: hypothetical protein IPH25_01930 [bacterium]